MKKRIDVKSFNYDYALKQLDTNIVWDVKQMQMLENRLLDGIAKIELRQESRFYNKFAYGLVLLTSIFVFLISFIYVLPTLKNLSFVSNYFGDTLDTEYKNSTKKIISKPEEKPIVVSNQIVYSKETNNKIVSTDALFEVLYDDIHGIYINSDLVAEVKVVDQEVRQTEAFDAETRSKVKIVQLFKGDTSLKEALVVELGGPLDTTKTKEMYKDKPGVVSGESPTIVETTLEGVPVMKKGNSYVLFLRKSPPVVGVEGVTGLENGFYLIVGSVQGKIKIDKEKNIAVATVEPTKINDKINFLQKAFAGKDIRILKEELNKLK